MGVSTGLASWTVSSRIGMPLITYAVNTEECWVICIRVDISKVLFHLYPSLKCRQLPSYASFKVELRTRKWRASTKYVPRIGT